MSTTMKAAIHMGQNYNENLEVFRNPNFFKIFSILLRIGIASSSGDSECEND